MVVRDEVEIPDKYYVHRGIVVDIGYREESDFIKRARAVRADWPIVADRTATGYPSSSGTAGSGSSTMQ